MDENAQAIGEEKRKEVYDDLAEAMISAVERGEMLYEEGQESANFILEKLDHITNAQELLAFLQELSNKWKIYEPVFTKIKGQEQQQADATQIADIENNLNQITNT